MSDLTQKYTVTWMLDDSHPDVRALMGVVRDRDTRIEALEAEVERLNEAVWQALDDMAAGHSVCEATKQMMMDAYKPNAEPDDLLSAFYLPSAFYCVRAALNAEGEQQHSDFDRPASAGTLRERYLELRDRQVRLISEIAKHDPAMAASARRVLSICEVCAQPRLNAKEEG